MQDKILDILNKSDRALSYNELHSSLNLNTIEETQEYIEVLDKLEKEGEVYLSKKNKYMLFSKGPFKKGKLSVNKKGFGFVDIGETEDIFISGDNLNSALNGDIVATEITENKADGRLEGKIVKVLKRSLDTFVGEFKVKRKKTYVIPDDVNLNIEVIIEQNQSKNAVDGHKVICKLKKALGDSKYYAEVLKIIGHKNDPGVDILSIVHKYDLKTEFSKETLDEVDNLSLEIKEKDREGRVNLTKERIFTIDGEDTKDIDDALSIKILENGNYELGVHIADVSYYVKEGSPLDNDAMERGTSVYLVDRVIPMLPHELSNGICSLNPQEERLAISCLMEIDSKAKIQNYEIFPSIIKSKKQMNYTSVNKIIENNESVEAYEDFEEDLKNMDALSKLIRKTKEARGAIDFASNEAKIIVDDKGYPIDVVLRSRGRGENIIEDFMIMANECIASHIFYMDLPFIYRIHESPKEEKMRDFLKFLSSLGYNYKANMKDMSPKSVQALIESLKDKKEFKILSNLVLRNMQKAIYLNQNLGHYGLASKAYTHFTSPIRRYPDLTVHRLLRKYLFESDISAQSVAKWNDKLSILADISSLKERLSIDCEREVESMKMAEYMEKHIGKEYRAMVSGVANYGIFVQLDNLIEGLVASSEMADYYIYNEDTQSLTGERTKKTYKLGDELTVRVIRASKEEKTIDFEIVEGGELNEKEKKT